MIGEAYGGCYRRYRRGPSSKRIRLREFTLASGGTDGP